MTHRYVIQGEPVSGKNSQQIRFNRRTGARYITKSDAAAGWQVDAVAQLVKQRGRRKTMQGAVRVEFVAWQRSKTRDLDNIAAALFDALKKARVIGDDAQITELAARKYTDPEDPCIEITLTPAQETAP